jgi:hypothetical protein
VPPPSGFNSSMSSATPPPSTYRLSVAVRARVLGGVLVGLGALVALVALLVWAFSLPGSVLGIALVLAAGGVVLSGFGVARAAPLVTLDEVGYRVRFLRGAGVVAARWPEVEDVVTATVAGDDCVVLRLRDGRTTTIPVAVLDVPRQDFVRDLGEHLHRGHGYRPVR